MQVGSSHPVRITASVNDPIILTNHGSTVYYGDYPEVSASSNTGSIADAATQTITSAQWVISANQSDVTTARVSDESVAVVDSVFGRGGAVVATTGDYTVAKVTGAAPIASPTFTGTTTAPEFTVTGLTGSTAASRYVGATATGSPASGAHLLGDFVIDQTGAVWVCTVAGTPGTWVTGTSGSAADKSSVSTQTFTGDLTAATMETTGNADVGGTLGVDGDATLDGAITAASLSVAGTTIAASTGNTDVNGTLGVDGDATFDGAISGASLSVAGTTIAASTGNVDVNGTLGVDGAATFDGAVTAGGVISPQSHATSGGPTYAEGAIYYDTTLHKLRVGGAAGWETITSV